MKDYLKQGDVVTLDCDTQSNFMLKDHSNFGRFERGESLATLAARYSLRGERGTGARKLEYHTGSGRWVSRDPNSFCGTV